MRNCNCSGAQCGCLVQGGAGITVTGTGTAADPYQVENTASDLGTSFQVNDTLTLNLTRAGSGSNVDPIILSGDVTMKMQQLTDVNDPTGIPLAGEVPTYVGVQGVDGHWEFKPGGSGGGTVYPLHFDLTKQGTLTVSTGVQTVYNDSGRTLTIIAVRASVGIAPGGASVVSDVRISGASIYASTPASKPTILTATTTDLGGTPDTVSWPNATPMTVDINGVGSSPAGSDLTLSVWAI